MNYVTREIMARFDLTAEAALQVQEVMDSSDIDYSECSKREYDRCMNKSYHDWRMAALSNFNPYISG